MGALLNRGGLRAALLALPLLLAACAAVRTPPRVRTYRLDYPAPPAAAAPRDSDQTLRVLPFGIAALYDRHGFVYRDSRYELATDSYNRWFATPANMVTDLIARDVAASGQFAAVLQGPSALGAAYELNGEIEEFEQRSDGGCSAHLRLRAFLVRVPGKGPRTVAFEQRFMADEPCSAGDPESFAAAMSRAVQQVSEQLQSAVASSAGVPAGTSVR